VKQPKILIEVHSDPRTCLCGWVRPVRAGFAKDEMGNEPIEVPETRFYFLYDCPQCGSRWNMLLERVDE
jgi:hypothetical protein